MKNSDDNLHQIDRPTFRIPVLVSCFNGNGETDYCFQVVESFRSDLDDETLNCVISGVIDSGYSGPFITYHGRQVRKLREMLNLGFADDSDIRICR